MDLIDAYENAKTSLIPKSGPLRSLAHVHAGMALFLLIALLTRRPLRSPVPILMLLLLELANEAIDMAGHWSHTRLWRIEDNGMDVVNTMLWPAVLFLLLRARLLAAG